MNMCPQMPSFQDTRRYRKIVLTIFINPPRYATVSQKGGICADMFIHIYFSFFAQETCFRSLAQARKITLYT